MQQETEWESFVPDSTNWGYEREGGENEDALQELSKAGGIQKNSGQTGVAGILLFLNKTHRVRINSDTRLVSHGPKQPTEQDNPDACTPTHRCHGNLPVPWPGFPSAGSLVFPNTVREVLTPWRESRFGEMITLWPLFSLGSMFSLAWEVKGQRDPRCYRDTSLILFPAAQSPRALLWKRQDWKLIWEPQGVP